MKNKAFSLVELAVVLVLIGILTMVTIQTMDSKIQDHSAAYYNVLDSLIKANYNVYADIHCVDDTYNPTTNSSDKLCAEGGRYYPKSRKELCERLSQYFNIAEGTLNCGDEPELSINETANNISNDNVSFVTTNSSRFFISDKQDLDISDGPTNCHKSFDYFVVYVDLNGDKEPNSVFVRNPIDTHATKILKTVNKVDDGRIRGTIPDIVPFVLTAKGEVIPVGYPLYSKRYMTTRVKYPISNLSDVNKQTLENNVSSSATFIESKINAVGNSECGDILYSIDFNTRFRNMNNLAFAFFNNSDEKDNMIDKTALPAGADVDHGCQENTFNCNLTIDRYMFKK